MNKKILLASFIFPERQEWFINYLATKFNITKDKIFCYQNIEDETKLIFTFKLSVPENKKIDLKNLFPNAIIIHKKGTAFYTINALNKLIETETDNSIGNIDYKAHIIDWSKYQDKFILLDGKELSILDLKRVF